MRSLKWFLIGFFIVVVAVFCTAQAYVIGEIPAHTDKFITLENQPRDYDISNPPQVEVSMFADFSDSAVGSFLFVVWDREDLTEAEQRLSMEFSGVDQLEKYVQIGISQPNKNVMIGEDGAYVNTESISWGWRYARLVTDEATKQCTAIDYYTNSGTTKKQLLGVLDQLTRLLTSQEPNLTTLEGAAKKSRSIADLQSKAEELTLELYTIRSIVDATE